MNSATPAVSAASDLKATVFNIMRYCVHDGPGIRTTVFLKGCPLRCSWCHNPEGQQKVVELSFREDRCVRCGDCFQICPNGAVRREGDRYLPLREACEGCGTCTDACYAEARQLVGTPMTVSEVMNEILKDIAFYDQSGGGVTFSGGEPLLWAAFLARAMCACKEFGIHTALETAGFAPWEQLEPVARVTDLFLYDLKLMDEEAHKRFTGVSSALILENLVRLSDQGAKITVRFPLVPGVNDHDANLRATAEFLRTRTTVRDVHILPFHRIGYEKSFRLGHESSMASLETPAEQKVHEAAWLFEQHQLHVTIGG
ncbi:MAG TPA: glycyl-radical enzyme activating protein [Bacteroidota bacterium]